MNLFEDKRTVLTLDAGGTNFVFSAMKAGEEILNPIVLPSFGDNLDKSLASMIEGFSMVCKGLDEAPSAISFAFPGPADYPNGIIGNLVNLPAYSGGVALGAFLKKQFDLPVYINNDGDLYAYGEALGGILPEVNANLEKAGIPKRYKNLIGLTLGTGFGGGIVRNGHLYLGDNAMAAEVYAFRNKLNPQWCAEDGISIRAVQYFYNKYSRKRGSSSLNPKDIFDIAKGEMEGDTEAAQKAFSSVGEVVGDVIAHLITTLDGLVVLGGGLTGASEFIFPAMLKEINSNLVLPDGSPIERLIQRVVSLDNDEGMSAIVNQKTIDIKVPGSDTVVKYNPDAILGVGTSRLGASRATALGAYAYALSALDTVQLSQQVSCY